MLHWYRDFDGANEDEFCPADSSAKIEKERLACLGPATIIETLDKGTENEYVVADVKQIMAAVKKDMAAEVADEAIAKTKAMVGGNWYRGDKRKRKKASGGCKSKKQRSSENKENENKENESTSSAMKPKGKRPAADAVLQPKNKQCKRASFVSVRVLMSDDDE